MRVIVTGGAGFIGSAVCRRLVRKAGWSVLNLDALTYAANLTSLAGIEASERYRFVQGDICDRPLLNQLFADFQPDAVMHLAAESHVDRSIAASPVFVQTNVVGTHTLLEAARAYWERLKGAQRERFRFLHVSTDEVYGSLGESGLFTETTPYDPHSPYSASKAASDHLVRAWGHTFGLPVIVSHGSNNYGPYQFPEKLIPVMIIRALAGAPLPLYGDGRHVRDWLYVDDHAAALECILCNGRVGASYNVGGRSERKNIDVVRAILDLVDELAPDRAMPRSEISFIADRPGHDRRYAMDSRKIETELGWRSIESLESGLRHTVKWYIDRRDWWEPIQAATFKGSSKAGSMIDPVA